MATEYEELRLVVNLVDNASSQLTTLNSKMQQLGSGPVTQSFHSLGRAADENLKKIAEMTKGILGLGKTFENLKAVFNPLTLAMGAFAYEVLRVNKALKDQAEGLVIMGNKAKLAATSLGEFKNFTDQLRKLGIDADAAERIMDGLSETAADLARGPFSQISQQLREHAFTPAQIDAVNKFTQAYIHATTQVERANITRKAALDAYNQAYREALQNHSSVAAAEAEGNARASEFLATVKQTNQFLLLNKDLIAPNQEDVQRWNQIESHAKVYYGITEDIHEKWDDIKLLLGDAAFGPGSPMLWVVTEIDKGLKKWDEDLQQTYERMKTAPARPGGLEGLNPWDPANIQREKTGMPALHPEGGSNILDAFSSWYGGGKHEEQVDKNTDQFKTLNDKIKRLNDSLGGKGGLPMFARGGGTTGRSIVGEKGPEIVKSVQTGKGGIVTSPTVVGAGQSVDPVDRTGWAQYMSDSSIRTSIGVRPELTNIIKQAQQDNPDLQFVVAPKGGTRTQAEQDALVKQGVSHTRQSYHLGGNAIDVVPLINGKMDFDSKEAQAAYAKIDNAMFAAADKLNITIGPEHAQIKSWDPGHYSIPPDKAVAAKMQGGGIVSGPTLIGEAGAEAVVPAHNLAMSGLRWLSGMVNERGHVVESPTTGGIRGQSGAILGGPVTRSNIRIPHSDPALRPGSEFAQRTGIYSNPFKDVSGELKSGWSSFKSAMQAEVSPGLVSGKLDVAQAVQNQGAAAMAALQESGSVTSSLYHTTLGRGISAVSGVSRETGNLASDVASVFGPGGALSAAGRFARGLGAGTRAVERAVLAGKAGQAGSHVLDLVGGGGTAGGGGASSTSGEITIDHTGGDQTAAPTSAGLFRNIPHQRQIQMQPAQVGPQPTAH